MCSWQRENVWRLPSSFKVTPKLNKLFSPGASKLNYRWWVQSHSRMYTFTNFPDSNFKILFDPFQKKNYELHNCFFQPLSASTESNLGSLDTVPAAEIGGPGGSIHPNCSPKEKATTKKCAWSEDQPKRPTNRIDMCVWVQLCACIIYNICVELGDTPDICSFFNDKFIQMSSNFMWQSLWRAAITTSLWRAAIAPYLGEKKTHKKMSSPQPFR